MFTNNYSAVGIEQKNSTVYRVSLRNMRTWKPEFTKGGSTEWGEVRIYDI